VQFLKKESGTNYFGEKWATNVKNILGENDLLGRSIHIISANMHSVKNMIFANAALKQNLKKK
jgi:hypothetical protein